MYPLSLIQRISLNLQTPAHVFAAFSMCTICFNARFDIYIAPQVSMGSDIYLHYTQALFTIYATLFIRHRVQSGQAHRQLAARLHIPKQHADRRLQGRSGVLVSREVGAQIRKLQEIIWLRCRRARGPG